MSRLLFFKILILIEIITQIDSLCTIENGCSCQNKNTIVVCAGLKLFKVPKLNNSVYLL
jgi:hypothetical protein